MDETTCPYCGKPLKPGRICAAKSTAPYWLPQGARFKGLFLTSKAVKRSKGRVLGTVFEATFCQDACPLTGFCEDCNVLITFMD